MEEIYGGCEAPVILTLHALSLRGTIVDTKTYYVIGFTVCKVAIRSSNRFGNPPLFTIIVKVELMNIFFALILCFLSCTCVSFVFLRDTSFFSYMI